MTQTSVLDVEEKHLAEVVQAHTAVCAGLLVLAQREAEALKGAGEYPMASFREERQALQRRLETSAAALAQQRDRWERLRPAGTPLAPKVQQELEAAQSTILRVLVLDRENEQNLLRRGLLPSRSLPPAEQSRPRYVFETYQRFRIA